jgi:hypothetical protein
MTRSSVSTHRQTRNLTWGALTALGAGLLCAAPAEAQPASAQQVVKAMSDYMASQNNLSGEFDVELDIITPQLEKVQFDASGTVQIARPDKLHVTRTGGYAEIELISDGKIVTILDRGGNAYAQHKSPGSVDNLINELRDQYGIDMPGADLLLTNSYDELMAGVIEAKHIGVGVIDGVECEHLAFRNADTDWQLWVRTGTRPLPCKYVISSKTVAGSPEYSIRFRSWTAGQAAPATAFNFTPKGARSVPFDQLSGIGELPPPAPLSMGAR